MLKHSATVKKVNLGEYCMEDFRPGEWLVLEQQVLESRANGKTFADLTAYRDVALWWFIRFRFFSRRTTGLVRSLTKNTLVFSLANFLYDSATCAICRIMSLPSSGRDRRKKTVMITVHDRDWKSMTSPDGKRWKGDAFFHTIIKELIGNGYGIVTVTPLKADLPHGLKTMVSRMKHQTQGLVHREFNVYWSFKTWKKESDARKIFKKRWQSAALSSSLLSKIREAGWQDDMPYYFNNIFGYVAKCLEVACNLVEQEKPDFILVSSEHGIVQKAIMVAGKMKGIPTMALQHGTIGHIHKGYLSWKGSISRSGSIDTPYCPIPDKTAVFGPYYFDLLTKASDYPQESVVSTGQPRYDMLVEATKMYNRASFFRRLGLDPERKMVLVATENLPIAEGTHLLRTTLKALHDFPEVQIVIKPHPAEPEEWYLEIAKQESPKATVLPKNADTYEALYACDLFVGSYSTVILEAVMLGKIGVTAFFNKGTDPTPYFREVTLRIYKEEEMSHAVRKALYDNNARESLKKAGAQFVFQHAYKTDGKATERVTQLIEKMMEEKA